MSAAIPRLRVFAGPNGSGKSVLKRALRPEWIGVYLNPDELESEARQTNRVNLAALGVECSQDELHSSLLSSSLLARASLTDRVTQLRYEDGIVHFDALPVNSYIASALVDLARRRLIDNRISFSFETVMSYPDKVDSLRNAQLAGFRTYLYYVATNHPDINVSRVAQRVRLGGHDVPEDKIRSRYGRSLELLWEAIRFTSRAYIFDNSGDELVWLAEINEGQEVTLKANFAPHWFQHAVLNKIN